MSASKTNIILLLLPKIASEHPKWELVRDYITAQHPREAGECLPAVERLIELKKQIKNHSFDVLEFQDTFLNVTLKPYLQLIAQAQMHLPLDNQAIAKDFRFNWKHVWDNKGPDSWAVSVNSGVEVGSILHNMAVCHVINGSLYIKEGGAASYKQAFQSFQHAAGCYDRILEVVTPRLAKHLQQSVAPDGGNTRGVAGTPASEQSASLDFDPHSARLLKSLCMAHAHHAGLLKAEIDFEGKYAVLAKICMDAVDLFTVLAAHSTPLDALPSVNKRASTFFDFLVQYSNDAARIFGAKAALYVSRVHMDKQEIAEVLYRTHIDGLQRIASDGLSRAYGKDWLKTLTLQSDLSELYHKADGLNSSVFFARVPEEMPPITGLGKPLGKPVPLPGPNHQIDGDTNNVVIADAFRTILAPNVMALVTEFRDRMNHGLKLKTQEVQQHRGSTSRQINDLGVQGFIFSLQESEREQKTGGGQIPPDLRRKIEVLRSRPQEMIALKARLSERPSQQGGADTPITHNTTETLMQTLVDDLSRVHEIASGTLDAIATIEQDLVAEKEQDQEGFSQFGSVIWRGARVASDDLPDVKALRSLMGDVKKAVDTELTQPLVAIKEELQQNAATLARLDWTFENLDGLMPFVNKQQNHEIKAEFADAIDRLTQCLQLIDEVSVVEDTGMQEVQRRVMDKEKLGIRILAAIANSGGDASSTGNDDVKGSIGTLGRSESTTEIGTADTILDILQMEMIDKFTDIDGAMKTRQSLLEEIETLMLKITAKRSEDPIAKECQLVCNSLEGSIREYKECREQLNNLALVGVTLLEKSSNAVQMARSLRHARSMEAEELRRILEANVSRQISEMRAKTETDSELRKREIDAEIKRLESVVKAHDVAAAHTQQTPTNAQAVNAAPHPAPPANAPVDIFATAATSQQQQQQPPAFGGPPAATAKYQYPGLSPSPPPVAQPSATVPTFLPTPGAPPAPLPTPAGAPPPSVVAQPARPPPPSSAPPAGEFDAYFE